MTALVALLASAPGASAQGGTPVLPGQSSGNPLAPFSPQSATPPPQTATTTTVSTTSTSGGGLSGTDAVLIGIGALVVLGGISLFIWRDARKRAPVRQRAAAAVAGPGARQRQQKARKLSPAERRRRKRGRAR